MKKQKENTTIHTYIEDTFIFPYISDELVKVLKEVYPNKLPQQQITEFELGRLIGQQEVIERLILEKTLNEEEIE